MIQRGRAATGITRGKRLEIEMDGARVEAVLGETVAAALIAAGRRGFRRADGSSALRGLDCGIGFCFDCLVGIDDQPRARAPRRKRS